MVMLKEKKRSDLFEALNNLFDKRVPVLSDRGQFDSVFMLNRFLSFYGGTFMAACDANHFLRECPKWVVHCFLFHSVEKCSRAPFIKLLKSPDKEKELVNYPVLAKRLCNYFCCSKVHGDMIFKILKNQGLDVFGIFGLEAR